VKVGDKEIIYWDSCIFYALLKEEKHRDGELEAILDLVDRIDREEVILTCSVLVIVEVLEGKLPGNAKRAFRDIFKRKNVIQIETTSKIAQIAHDIRDYYRNNPIYSGNGIPLMPSVPDSIHLASAIFSKASPFYTLDDKNKNNKNEVSLTKLSGNVAGQHSIKITRPIPPLQRKLELIS
jgi:predicted nucleic acid-binding protein